MQRSFSVRIEQTRSRTARYDIIVYEPCGAERGKKIVKSFSRSIFKNTVELVLRERLTRKKVKHYTNRMFSSPYNMDI